MSKANRITRFHNKSYHDEPQRLIVRKESPRISEQETVCSWHLLIYLKNLYIYIKKKHYKEAIYVFFRLFCVKKIKESLKAKQVRKLYLAVYLASFIFTIFIIKKLKKTMKELHLYTLHMLEGCGWLFSYLQNIREYVLSSVYNSL